MLCGGMQKLTTLDFPGLVGAIIFTRGCNFNCPYCHNPQLVKRAFYLKSDAPKGSSGDMPAPLEPRAEMDEVFAFLRKRRGLLDGLVISGGEPCLQSDLPDFCREVRKLGYKLKLDTNGSRPEMLGTLLDFNLLDYVAMDLKTLPELYRPLGFCSENDIQEKITASLELLRERGVPHELRTTCALPLLNKDIIVQMAGLAGSHTPWFLQRARLDGEILEPQAALREPVIEELEDWCAQARELAPLANLRR